MRVIAAIVLAVWCGTIGFDPWCCPDGCTDDVEHASPGAGDDDQSGGADCILCLGGIEHPSNQSSSLPVVARDFALLQPRLFLDVYLPPAEQPPRS